MNFKFRIRTKIKEAWPLYKENFSIFILFTILIFAAQFISDGKHWLPIIVLYILNFIISYTWIKSTINLIDGKSFNPFSKSSLPNLIQFWRYLKVVVLVMVFSLVGFALFIVPGFYVVGRLMFAPYMSIEEGGKSWEVIKKSWNMTKGYGWKIFWKSFVVQLFTVAGFLALFVGIFITYPISVIVFVKLYKDFIAFKENIKSETDIAKN